MNKTLNLEFGEYYHIYNRGNNRDLLFFEERNYHYFLVLLKKYLLPVADLYAFCLLPNHFHFLLKIKTEEELIDFNEEIAKLKVTSREHLFLSRKFSNYFNAYGKAINAVYQRRGSLFQERFGRIKIESENYFSSLIYYIHNNPVKHGLVSRIADYPYSSYNQILSGDNSLIKREIVLECFGGLEEFIKFQEAGVQNLTGFENL